ncbi:NAD(P)-dependent oxidoreductase [Microbispora rosea]|uniref:NAD(P)-dependent oxidoreductase n=1 Tax=Microbispora rosea TaxID=58117 RepID=UPI0033F5B017
MRVTVFGASGRTGRLVVERALARGHDVTAVTRAPASVAGGAGPRHPGRLEILRGDVGDLASVREAVRDRDVVLSLVAPPLARHVLRSTSLYSEAGRNLVRAMRTTASGRLITVSSAGVVDGDPSHPPLYRLVLKPLLFDRALYRDMRIMEKEVEDSRLEWIVVRASGLTNRPPTGRYRVGLGRLPQGGSRVSRADLADFLIAQFDGTTYVGEHPTVAY